MKERGSEVCSELDLVAEKGYVMPSFLYNRNDGIHGTVLAFSEKYDEHTDRHRIYFRQNYAYPPFALFTDRRKREDSLCRADSECTLYEFVLFKIVIQ